MRKKSWLIVSIFTILCSLYIHGQSQQRQEMDINELFMLTEKNSKSINSYKTGVLAASEAVKASKSSRLPDIEASLSGSYIGNGYLWNRNFKDAMSISMPHWGNNFSILVSQVIYAGGAIDNSIALASLKKKMAQLDLDKNRQDIRFMLIGEYLDMCKIINQQKVMKRNIDLTQNIIDNTKLRTQQGTALKNDITRYELQMENMKLQLQKLEDAYSILNYNIIITVGLSEGTEIIPNEEEYEKILEKRNEKQWQEISEKENVNIIQAETAVNMNEKLLKIERSSMLPQIMFIAEEHLDGPILIEVPVINKNFNYWYFGLGVKYNISSFFKKNKKINESALKLSQSQQSYSLAKENIKKAVNASYTDYMTSFTEYNTQQKSVELATRNYNVINDRYENGLALLTDMLDASNIKLSAELNLVNARINILYNYYKIKYNSSSL